MEDLVTGILQKLTQSSKRDIDSVMEEFRSNGRESSLEPEESSSVESLSYSSGASTNSGGSYFPESFDQCYSRFIAGASNSMQCGSYLPENCVQSLEVPTLTSLDDQVYPDTNGVWIYAEEEDIWTHSPMDDQTAIANGANGTQQLKKPRRNHRGGIKTRACTFCMNNGESRQYYSQHYLHGCDGLVTCPILFRYVCPICGATGSHAHTRNYCPLNANKEEVPVMNVLRTMRSATGKFRPVKYNNENWK